MSAHPKPRLTQPNGRRPRHHRPANQSVTSSVLIDIPRSLIEAGNLEQFIATLESLMETPDTVRRYRNRLFICVSGYDGDPRELHQIPEVCSFLAKLDELFPYWFWYLNRKEPSFLITLLQCLSRSENFDDARDFDLHRVEHFMLRHYQAIEELGALNRLKDIEVMSRIEVIEKYYRQYESSSEITIVYSEPQAPAYWKRLKIGLLCGGSLALLISWLLALIFSSSVTLINIAGPITLGLGASYAFMPERELTENPGLSTRNRVILFAGLIAGALLSILNDHLLRKL